MKKTKKTSVEFSDSRSRHRLGKKGQFYLITAFVIIAVIVGSIAISNYVKKQSSTRLYNLREDLEIESENVLEYGTYSEFDEVQMQELLSNFTETYSEYVGEGIQIYFVFGNRYKIIVAGYQELASETIYVAGSPMMITEGEYTYEEFDLSDSDENRIIVTIDSIEYEFRLKAGENFYFVISQEIEGEEHIVTS